MLIARLSNFFFFNDTATTEIYTLSLHDALPISSLPGRIKNTTPSAPASSYWRTRSGCGRSEEHTSELQSQSNLVCRLLLEKKIRVGVALLILLLHVLEVGVSSRSARVVQLEIVA